MDEGRGECLLQQDLPPFEQAIDSDPSNSFEALEHLAANFVERIIVRDFMLVVVRVTLVRVHAAYAAARVHDIRSYQTIPARKE